MQWPHNTKYELHGNHRSATRRISAACTGSGAGLSLTSLRDVAGFCCAIRSSAMSDRCQCCGTRDDDQPVFKVLTLRSLVSSTSPSCTTSKRATA
jgi:hypothetical protein